MAFWNFVGAGLFGFLINPPIALYYMQGLEHDAGARTYGAVRRVRHAGAGLDAVLPARAAPRHGVEGRSPGVAFWASMSGSALMVLLSMLPIGLMQAWASVEYGTWYARSAEFLHTAG